MAVARDLNKETNSVIAILGDGALTGGLAYEGINNGGQLKTPLIVVLNDNAMSISPNVGAVANILERVRTEPSYSAAKGQVEHLLNMMPMGGTALGAAKRFKKGVKDFMLFNVFWEELGFTYLGPVDGHDIGRLRSVFRRAKKMRSPVLVHMYTTKGKGYDPAEADNYKFHSVSAPGGSKPAAPNYDAVFGRTLCAIAAEDPKVVAITAGMCGGTGLTGFSERFPDRFFDVGIAEGHAVTFAAGLATQDLRPVAAIYSTFLQRAYDHLISA